MTETGLCYEGTLALQWHPLGVADTRDVEREALLLLTAINQMEASQDLESSSEHRRLDRLEAKLDLALYLLARTLESQPISAPVAVRLSPNGIQWQENQPPEAGSFLLLELRPSTPLPLSLRLPARAREAHGGWAQADFHNLPEALAEALYQFIFRRHRQAIRARQGNDKDTSPG